MSDFDPADVPAAGSSGFSDPLSSRLADLTDTADEPERPDREGLPARYRMRAEPHYVEQLFDEGARREPTPPAARRALGKARVRPPQARQERVLVQIAHDLTEIESAASLLERATSGSARRVGLDLIRARTWHTNWLLRANAILEGTHRGRLRRQPIEPVLAAVVDRLVPECRLAGVRLELDRSVDAEVEVDGEALAAAATGGVFWALGSLTGAAGAAIRLETRVGDEGVVRVEIGLSETGDGDDAPAGPADSWTADLGASVAKKVAGMHGGEAVFLVADGQRSVVRLTIAGPA